MVRIRPTLRGGTLLVESPTNHKFMEIPAESDAWYTWLQTAKSFAYEDTSGRFTVRKKRRWRGDYWYAVRRYGDRLRETYLGKARDLTLGRLHVAVVKLNDLTRARIPATPHQSTPAPIPLSALNDSSALLRGRALDRLRQATIYPVTVISAPAGYGKSTLLAQWIQLSQLPVASLTVDVQDNAPERFWGRVVAALGRLTPELVRHPSPPPQTSDASQADTAQTALSALVAAMLAAPEPMILILDDYDKLWPDNASVHDGMAYLLEYLPPQAHVILACRGAPPLSLAKLRAGHQLLELGTADLQLTLSETSELLTHVMRLVLSEADVVTLHARTEGWIAGLQLAVSWIQAKPHVEERIREFNGENRYIYDYVVEEVINRVPLETGAFALSVSLLQPFNASLCDAVTQSNRSQVALSELEQRGLFLVPLDDRAGWYRFHALVAEALRRHLRMTRPEDEPDVYSRASVWCEESGMLREAIEYALAANTNERAARLIELFIPSAMAHDERVLVRDLLGRLPDALVRGRPGLCVAHAYAIFMTGGDRVLMRQRVRDAEQALQQSAPFQPPYDVAVARGESLALSTTVDFLLAEKDLPDLIALHRQALAALPRHHWLRGFITLFIGMEQLASGDVRAACRTLDIVMRSSRSRGDAFYVGLAIAFLGLALVQQGRLDDALARCDHATRHLADFGDDALFAHVEFIRGLVFYHRNELERALTSLRSGISMKYSPAPLLLEALPTLAYILFAMSDVDGAWSASESSIAEWLGMQAENMMVWAWTGRMTQAHRARLRLLEGDVSAATSWAGGLDRGGMRDEAGGVEPPSYVREWEDLVLCRLLLAQRRPHDALELLTTVAGAADAAGRKSRQLESLILQAVAYDALGNITAGLQALGHSIELAAPQGIVRVFVEGGPSIQRLLGKLQTETSRVVFVSADAAWRRHLTTVASACTPRRSDDEHAASNMNIEDDNESQLALPTPRATRRQLEILRLIAEGATNEEIATVLVITLSTVKRHVSNILLALDARNRTQAVARARALGLLAIGTENNTSDNSAM